MNYSGSQTTSRRSTWLKFASATLIALAVAGCGGGSDGAAGAPGAPGAPADPTALNDLTAQVTALTQAASPETCSNCHTGDAPLAAAGKGHQAEYDKYTDASKFTLTVDGVASVPNADGTTFTSTLTFTAKKSASPLSNAEVAALAQKRFYAVKYDSTTRQFTPSFSFTASALADFTPTATLGQFTVEAAKATFKPEATNAQAYAYIADGVLKTEGMTLYDDVANAGKVFNPLVAYDSTANVTGCETCHGTPYMKHGYRAAKVDGLPDFAACKNCHFDTKDGGHQFWQVLKDDPVRAAQVNDGSVPLTTAEKTKYAYKANIMNDVHMSHAMEFAYPQSMKNCSTCHADKLDRIFTDAAFKPETCISCHAVDGLKGMMAAAKYNHSDYIGTDAELKASNDCVLCHKVSGSRPTIRSIHNGGFNPKIYTAAGQRYSEVIKVTMDTPTIDGNTLTIKFSAADTGATGFDMATIKPTVLVGLYGYNTKDFIVAAHGSAPDKARNLEYLVGSEHPRFTTVSAGAGKWEVTADLSLWADKIAAGTIKRAEIAVMPYLDHPTITVTNRSGDVVADAIGLNAPSVTFNLSTKKVEAGFGKIVSEAKCNSCHDQLATTFHSADRGGNVKVCRICHEVSNAGSHLEMQSRSIDSYVHAIHSFQAFDLEGIDLTDPVQKMKYEEHTASTFPNFTIKNCESCHVDRASNGTTTYDVPSQAKSMPGLLSGNETLKGGTRNIGTVPAYVTGPAVRACGSCHRSQMITAEEGLGDAAGLAVLNSHFFKEGYLVENVTGLWDSVVAKLMAMF